MNTPPFASHANVLPLFEARHMVLARSDYVANYGNYVKPVMSENSLQWQWRVDPNRPWDYHAATTAVLDALVIQGGIVAWDGDGVGCVVQMIEAQWNRAEQAIEKCAQIVDKHKPDTSFDDSSAGYIERSALLINIAAEIRALKR